MGHAIRRKAGHGSTFSSLAHIEKLVWLGVGGPSYQQDRVQVAVASVCELFSSEHLGPQMNTVHI